MGASSDGIHNGCQVRICTDTEVCVPMRTAASQHKCLALAVDCGTPQPSDPANSAFTYAGTQVGHEATLTCQPSFVLSPSGSASTVVCQANSQWTSASVTCHQVAAVTPTCAFVDEMGGGGLVNNVFFIFFFIEGFYYRPVNRTGSPQSFSLNQILQKLNTIQTMHILQT